MRLSVPTQSLEQKVWEFDFWVTPSMVDIRSTDRFKLELRRIVGVLETLSIGAGGNLDEARFSADLVDRVFDHLDALSSTTTGDALLVVTEEFLKSLSALLFLVTGKSDNNNKCQFPIYLRNQVGWETIPTLRSKRGKSIASGEIIPRVLDSESFMSRIARMYAAEKRGQDELSLRGVAPSLLFQFVNSLLLDAPSRAQLSAFLEYYRKAKNVGEDTAVLITPLVMFQVRGSVAASGGHEPEELLRKRMTDWGMIREIDFNAADVVLDVEAGLIFESRGEVQEEKKGKTKTRAYDFVLPFRTSGWHPMIFIQSQFYAGDSGSVSHKNVDQTSSSRLSATRLVAKAWPGSLRPRFLEYVDGAGYSASLNADLRSLLSFSDTAGFFQVRTAPIRLRRELQQIGFLTPLEIGHSILRTGGVQADVVSLLESEGYSPTEMERVLKVSQEMGIVTLRRGRFDISRKFLPTVRRHLLLDFIACEGVGYPSLNGVTGVALVPGYGRFHGLALSELEKRIRQCMRSVWPKGFMVDLQQLCESGMVVLR